MICIAAFIVLAVSSLAIPVVRLFNKDLAGNMVRLFKKATHCFTRRATLRACDSSFKDDVKNSLLKKLVLKHPSLVKPAAGAIEFVALLIIILTAWSLLVGAKSLVSLYVYGTCNPASPSSCSLDSTESCTIDQAPIKFGKDPIKWTTNWFSEFATAIKAMPDRWKDWPADRYLPKLDSYYGGYDKSKPIAVDVFDPGCAVCRNSFRSQLKRGFMAKYNVALVPYPIKSTTTSGGYKFVNSYIIASYIVASQLDPLPSAKNPAAWQIVERLFTGKTSDGDDYQTAFNLAYSQEEAEKVLQTWLGDFGYDSDQVHNLAEIAHWDEVKKLIDSNISLVNDRIKTKKIPTAIYNGQRHDGAFTDQTKF